MTELNVKGLGEAAGRDWHLWHADTVEVSAALPEESVHLSVYSPPFSSLYIYSESERDMGNVASDAEFHAFYARVVAALARAAVPGGISAVHVQDLPLYSNASAGGERGLRPFMLDCLALHLEHGWTYHGLVTIPRCPVEEQRKTHADRLLFKHFRTDARRCSVGMPEYLMVFRAWKDGMDVVPPVTHDPASYPLDIWQQWANPIWDLPATDVLNVALARGAKDEKHLCPMPLNITERAVQLWTNPGETVYSPFAGIGSEGVAALRHGRRFVGCELNRGYFEQACRFLDEAAAAPASMLEAV